MGELTGNADPPAWCSGCSMNLILHITAVWGGGELGVGWQGGVHHQGEQQAQGHLHTTVYSRAHQVMQGSLGKVEAVQEVVHVRKVHSLISQHIGQGQEADCHFFLTEGRDTSV